jgi:hypothetical protein
MGDIMFHALAASSRYVACERDNLWTVHSTASLLHRIVYLYKGKNWLETGGANYTIGD